MKPRRKISYQKRSFYYLPYDRCSFILDYIFKTHLNIEENFPVIISNIKITQPDFYKGERSHQY